MALADRAGTAASEARADAPASPWGQRPVLVLWETTRACPLACRHCRAEARRDPVPGELSTAEGIRLLQEIRAFGRPAPAVVFSGGDPLARADLFQLLDAAAGLGLATAIAPAVSPALNGATVRRLAAAGVHALSVSIDAWGAQHDELRGAEGTFARSLQALDLAMAAGLQVQVNTVVMRSTAPALPALAATLLERGVRTWEVFFLVATGRALASEYLSPREVEDVCHFLLDAAGHGLAVRTVEAPMLRRVAQQRAAGESVTGPLYRTLSAELAVRCGPPTGAAPRPRRGTLDGDGIVFVAHDGTIMPGGLLPVALGNVRADSLVEVYRGHPLLRAIRERRLHGACGACAWRQVCGGSRARGYAAGGDALGPDPACYEAVRNPHLA